MPRGGVGYTASSDETRLGGAVAYRETGRRGLNAGEIVTRNSSFVKLAGSHQAGRQ